MKENTSLARKAVRRRMDRRRANRSTLLGRLILILILLMLLGASITGIVVAGGAGVAGYNVSSYYNSIVPAGITQLKQYEAAPNQSTRIYDRTGQHLLAELYDPSVGMRQPVHIQDISPWVITATVAMEDPTFFSNLGFDPRGLVRALYEDLRYKQ